MTHSANEVMTLAEKAARGAGAPAGQAAAFGRAAVRHLAAGRAVSDLTAALEALPNGPILTLPTTFNRCAEAAAQGPVTCALPRGALVISYAEAQPYYVDLSDDPATVDATIPAAAAPFTRLTLSEALAAYMESFAARTRVPETEASRLAGAGAGLTDND